MEKGVKLCFYKKYFVLKLSKVKQTIYINTWFPTYF